VLDAALAAGAVVVFVLVALGIVVALVVIVASAYHAAVAALHGRATVAIAIIIAIVMIVVVTIIILIALAAADAARHTRHAHRRIARRFHVRLAGRAAACRTLLISLRVIIFVALIIVVLALAIAVLALAVLALVTATLPLVVAAARRARDGCAEWANQTEVDRRAISNFRPNESLAFATKKNSRYERERAGARAVGQSESIALSGWNCDAEASVRRHWCGIAHVLAGLDEHYRLTKAVIGQVDLSVKGSWLLTVITACKGQHY
jgi:hypothetical protein